MSSDIFTKYVLCRRTSSGEFCDYIFDSKKTLNDMVEWANREFDIRDQTFSKDGRCCILTAYPKSNLSPVGRFNSCSLQEAV